MSPAGSIEYTLPHECLHPRFDNRLYMCNQTDSMTQMICVFNIKAIKHVLVETQNTNFEPENPL